MQGLRHNFHQSLQESGMFETEQKKAKAAFEYALQDTIRFFQSTMNLDDKKIITGKQ